MYADGAVDAGVELVLVVGIVSGAAVVVGDQSGDGRGETCEQSDGGGIEGRVDHVVGEFAADVDAANDSGGAGIVDVRDTGEDALALVHRRDSGEFKDVCVCHW